LVRPDIRLNMEFPIVLLSGLARLPGPAQLRMNDCRYKYGRIVTEDCWLIVQPSVIPVTIPGLGRGLGAVCCLADNLPGAGDVLGVARASKSELTGGGSESETVDGVRGVRAGPR
jgi:hypothetical protein